MHQKLYKKGIDREERQEVRRQKLLEEQKLKRFQEQDDRRRLHRTTPRASCSNAKYKQPTFQDLYGNEVSLQLSEWMRELPEDLSDWILVPCPKGQRCLVTTSRGKTKMFSKAGRFRMSFKSFLPGGCGNAAVKAVGSGFCVLDCVYNADKDSFYVLDVLWYGKQCFLDCDAQFRFFWLKSKFEEFSDADLLTAPIGENFKAFHLLNTADMNNATSTAYALQSYPLWTDNSPQLDGFLFYHKESIYTSGTTPLVCWLFPFMVPDVLHMIINDLYEKPSNYSNPWTFIEDFEKEMSRKRQRRQAKQMDCESFIDSVNSSIDTPCCIANEMEETEDGEHQDCNLGDDDCSSLMKVINSERTLELEGNPEH